MLYDYIMPTFLSPLLPYHRLAWDPPHDPCIPYDFSPEFVYIVRVFNLLLGSSGPPEELVEEITHMMSIRQSGHPVKTIHLSDLIQEARMYQMDIQRYQDFCDAFRPREVLS